MALLSDQDRTVVREHLAPLQKPVTLLFFTQTIGAPETAVLTRQVLDEIVGLNDLIHVEEVNFVLERDRAEQYGIERIPAIALLSAGRGHAHALPRRAGWLRVHVAHRSGGSRRHRRFAADGRQRDLISAHATGPLDIQVFVTPT